MNGFLRTSECAQKIVGMCVYPVNDGEYSEYDSISDKCRYNMVLCFLCAMPYLFYLVVISLTIFLIYIMRIMVSL